MKRATIFFLLLLVIPSLVFSVNNAKINGQKEITITQLPVDVVFTCDLAQTGNKLAFEYYVDFDGNGEIGPQEMIVDFFYVADGIGWIEDPQDPDGDFAGDETGVDGKLQITFTIEADEVFIPVGMSGIYKLIDENGSTDQVIIKFQSDNPNPQSPFIQGKVTDKSTGSPIPGALVAAADVENSNFGIADNNGDYKISVTPGTYKVAAMEFSMNTYQPSDSVEVTVVGTQSQTVNFALEPYSCFINGKLTLENGTPVPGIMVIATGDFQSLFSSRVTSDDQGNYSMGVMPGTVFVSVSYIFNMGNENWPQDHYVEPQADSLNISAGQTLTSNFVFKPYNSFVSGKCTVDGVALPGVEITGFPMDGTMNFYETYSGQDGNYKLGVLPGTLMILSAKKEGYSVTSPPMTGMYMQVEVASGQTVTGKDFAFALAGTMTSIAGTVTFSNGSAAANVYVAAENYDEECPEGFLITHTDGSGNYLFENVLEGDYHLGVYWTGYSSNPAMRYFDIYMGEAQTSQDFVLTLGTGVETKDRILKPRTINLSQNYPNPFNPTTTIRFDLPAASDVKVYIFNATGQKIRTLVNGNFSAGQRQVEWDGRNDAGQKVTSGFYFYQLNTGNYNKVMKMILAK